MPLQQLQVCARRARRVGQVIAGRLSGLKDLLQSAQAVSWQHATLLPVLSVMKDHNRNQQPNVQLLSRERGELRSGMRGTQKNLGPKNENASSVLIQKQQGS